MLSRVSLIHLSFDAPWHGGRCHAIVFRRAAKIAQKVEGHYSTFSSTAVVGSLLALAPLFPILGNSDFGRVSGRGGLPTDIAYGDPKSWVPSGDS
jgi:hypothetical protein